MLLAQITDTHLLPLNEKDPLARLRAENLQRCINTINQMPEQPRAVVHTGDMINFGLDNNYGLAREIHSQIKAPFFPAIGNRDSRPDLIAAFHAPHRVAKNAPYCQYRVELDGFDVVCVDTKSATHNVGASSAQSRSQVDQLLSENKERPVFVFLHHPPVEIPALSQPLQFESIEQARALTQVFDKYDNIVRVLCGHTHRSDIVKMGRHFASTLPSLATDVRLDQYPTHLGNEPFFQVHQLHDDNSVTSMSHFALRNFRRAA